MTHIISYESYDIASIQGKRRHQDISKNMLRHHPPLRNDYVISYY